MPEVPHHDTYQEATVEKPVFNGELFSQYQSNIRRLERAQQEAYARLVEQLEAGVGQTVVARFEPTRVRYNETPNQTHPAYKPGSVNHAPIEAAVTIEGVYKERGDVLFGAGEHIDGVRQMTYLVPIANIEHIAAE